MLLVAPVPAPGGELFKKFVEFRGRLDPAPALSEDNAVCAAPSPARLARASACPASEATVRGFSAPALIIEDEAARVPTRCTEASAQCWRLTGGRLILMSTPVRAGRALLEEWSAGGETGNG